MDTIESGKKKRKFTWKLSFNSPVILGFTVISFAVLIINYIVGLVHDGGITQYLYIYKSSFADPRMYIRMLTHIFSHADLEHFAGNFLLILAIGPLVEEKYGSKRLAIMILLTAFITGLLTVIIFPQYALHGASGVVFMLILLASFTNLQEKKIPLTFILVALLYIGQEVVSMIAVNDNISQGAHILGGLCGAGFGVYLNSSKLFGKKNG